MFVRLFLSSARLFFFETLNGRLPLEQSSDRCETLAKGVSDGLQLFIVRRQTILENKLQNKFGGRILFLKKGCLGGAMNFQSALADST